MPDRTGTSRNFYDLFAIFLSRLVVIRNLRWKLDKDYFSAMAI